MHWLAVKQSYLAWTAADKGGHRHCCIMHSAVSIRLSASRLQLMDQSIE